VPLRRLLATTLESISSSHTAARIDSGSSPTRKRQYRPPQCKASAKSRTARVSQRQQARCRALTSFPAPASVTLLHQQLRRWVHIVLASCRLQLLPELRQLQCYQLDTSSRRAWPVLTRGACFSCRVLASEWREEKINCSQAPRLLMASTSSNNHPAPSRNRLKSYT
jgi:hypothetical protein